MNKALITLILSTCLASFSFGQNGYAKPEISVFTTKDLYVIHARVLDKTGVAAAGVRGFVTVPGHHFEMRSELSDSSGNLFFLMKDIEGSKQLIFQAQSEKDSAFRFEFGAPFITENPFAELPGTTPFQPDTLPFYGLADKSYLLDDYTRFPTIEEVIREYISDVRIRKVKDQYYFSVVNTPFNKFFEKPPLILWDGVPVFDMNYLVTLDPLKIKKVEVVARTYFYGSLVCNGIVSFFSYNGDMAGFTLPPQAVVREINNMKSFK